MEQTCARFPLLPGAATQFVSDVESSTVLRLRNSVLRHWVHKNIPVKPKNVSIWERWE
jgi:hypothetical protein